MVSFRFLNNPLEIASTLPKSALNTVKSAQSCLSEEAGYPHAPPPAPSSPSSSEGRACWITYSGLVSGSDWAQWELPRHQFCTSTPIAQTEFSQKLNQNRHKPSGCLRVSNLPAKLENFPSGAHLPFASNTLYLMNGRTSWSLHNCQGKVKLYQKYS